MSYQTEQQAVARPIEHRELSELLSGNNLPLRQIHA
jgi:hypothetical protein